MEENAACVIAFDKTNNGKSLEFGQERLQTPKKENNNNPDQYLSIDSLPKLLKAVYETNSGNVLSHNKSPLRED